MKLISKAKGINEPIRLISRDIINIVKSQNYSNYFLPEDISNDVFKQLGLIDIYII
jgi:hypothetical protein